ncbi:nmrA-like family domain-containing protein 1 [Lytechinus variegatus]|uniref:nmrA-like family domain-containing protein 1 n=1 Tax=Lytechinus variegatus TaxID=7654 RepID=UPI001BB20170|nr:nmrA-like family domain-containing protein 1 [Lytechinus variegatus]
MAKLITVFGATGTQGGSLVRALLQDSNFKVRGITRNVDSEKAKALAQKGVEMVKASTDDVSSLEPAMAGSYGVFAMTSYWELMDQAKEVEMGKNMVDVARKVGVKHFVFSGLQSVKKAIGKPCPHFDGKAEIEEYMFASGLPASSVRYAMYMDNIFTQTTPQNVGGDEYLWHIPVANQKLHMVYTSEAGRAVAAIFKNPDEYIGKSVGLAGDERTVSQYCDILNSHLAPAKVTPSPMTPEDFSKLPIPGADDFAVMFEFLQTDHPCYSVDETKKLDQNTIDFEGFVKANKEKILAAMNKNTSH